MQASLAMDLGPSRAIPDGARRAGAWGALARGGFNLAQFVFVLVHMRIIGEAGDYDPAVLKANAPLLYIDAVILLGMGLGWIVAVWGLHDLMRERAPMLMRISLVTAIVGGAAFFVTAGQAIARVDGLFLVEDFSPELQTFSLHLLDIQSVVFGHVMVMTAAISTLLWGTAALRTGMLGRRLAIAAIVGGVVAVFLEFTPMNLLGFLFQTPIFLWLGVVLWRSSGLEGQPAASVEVAR